MFQQAPQDAGTVQVHVQVIDLEPFALDLVVPTYLPARDLTERIATDAGLGAYWEDGTKRNFFLRARGRLLGDDERLEDLGVVPYELLHLLPEPPKGTGVEERPPEYPPNRGYFGAGNINVLGGLVMVMAWTLGWGVGLTVSQGPVMSLLPAVGLALLTTSFARHLWGGSGSAVKIPVTGLVLYLPLLLVAVLPAFILGYTDAKGLALMAVPAFVAGLFGVTLGWLAWYGAVEPLPKVTAKQVKEFHESVTYPCGICGGPVTQDQRADCSFGCGRAFHVGCYKAKTALAADSNICAICGYSPG